jgi:hypothetical protein
LGRLVIEAWVCFGPVHVSSIAFVGLPGGRRQVCGGFRQVTAADAGRIFAEGKLAAMGNVFDAILQFGHDEDYSPRITDEFIATDAPAGSNEKLEVLARRIAMGLPLWHPEDRHDYSGLTGAVRPRE